MSGALDHVVAILVVIFINVAIVARVGASRDPNRRFVVRTYLWTLGLRVVLAILLNVLAQSSAFAAAFWGDSDAYDAGGALLARRWRGEFVTVAPESLVSGYGFVYFVGAVYFLFGRNQILIQLLNATIGAATVLVLYSIANHLFGGPAARWAALFMGFFPQMLFWSAGMYKDAAVLLGIAVCMYAVLNLRGTFDPGHILLFVCAAFALLTLRFYIFYFVVAASVGTLVFGGRRGVAQRLASFIVLIGAIGGALTVGVRQETLQGQAAMMTLEQAQVTRADQAMWGRSAYGAGYDVTTLTGAIKALPVGVVYLLFAPFPWAISGIRQILTIPETLVWYALMPAFFRGLLHAVRHRLRDVLPILVFTATLTVAYALTQGNVGTAYRQRTQVTMFFFLFMAVGMVERRRGIDVSEYGHDVGRAVG